MALRALCLGLLGLATVANGHMTLVWPCQRGTLAGNNMIDNPRVVDPEAPKDFKPHFPAGDDAPSPGSALRSQIAEAGLAGWTPFEPEKVDFHWRNGVCGDLKSNPKHLRGGEFYHNGMPVDTYEQGGVISIDIAVTAHHNGFLEIRCCNVKACGGEISEDCFREGHCPKLKRVSDPSCESRTDPLCAPINPDPRYENRWDLPCSKADTDMYGDGKIKYYLPEGWSGPHFVLHLFYTAANSCMPLGVTDFFTGPRGPQWGECEGQGGAVGGYRRFDALCGGDKFPEEYSKCADIAINAGAVSPTSNPVPVTPTPARPTPSSTSAPVAPAPSTTSSRAPPTPSSSSSPVRPTPSRSSMPVLPSRAPVAPPPAPSTPAQSPEPLPVIPDLPPPLMAPAPVTPAPVDDVLTPPQPSADPTTPIPVGPLTEIVLIGDGVQYQSFGNGSTIILDVRSFSQITFQMVTARVVEPMLWYIDGRQVWTEQSTPYFLGGNSQAGVPAHWQLPLNRKFTLKVVSGTFEMTAHVTLSR